MSPKTDAPARDGRLRDWLPSIYRASAVIAVAIGFLFFLSDRISFNDDLVWLYSASFIADKPEAFAEGKRLIAEKLVEAGTDNVAQYRLALRDGFEDNYRLFIYTGYLARLITQPLPPGVDIARDAAAQQVLLRRISLTHALGFLTAVVLFWLGLRGVHRRLVLGSVTFVLVGMLLVNFLPITSAPIALNNIHYWVKLSLDPGESLFGRMLETTISFLVHPGPWFVPFYLPPKNQFQLILIAIMALRWSDRHAAAYLLLAVACVFHHSYAAFIVIFLATFDAWWRPATLLRPAVILLATVPIVANMTRSAGHTDWSLSIIAPAVVLLGAFGLGVIRRAGVFGPPDRPAIFPRLSPVSQDLVGYWAIWAVSAAAFAVAALYASPLEAQYFWSNLHSRLYGLMLPPTYVGIVILLAAAASQRNLPLVPFFRRREALVAPVLLAGGLLLSLVPLLRQDLGAVLYPEARRAPASSHCEFDAVGWRYEGSYFTQLVVDLELATTERTRAFFAPCPRVPQPSQ